MAYHAIAALTAYRYGAWQTARWVLAWALAFGLAAAACYVAGATVLRIRDRLLEGE